MRRYDDPVEVRRGMVRDLVRDQRGARGAEAGPGQEGPEQFLWRGRLWQVRAVLAHWVETGPWWSGAQARSVIGSEQEGATGAGGPGAGGSGGGTATAVAVDLLAERELWRVEARRGAGDPGGVFDLAFDWTDGRWQLVGCLD